MEGKRFIRSVRLENFLSFSGESEAIDLMPLNVLIGPNASGKSNLIEAFSILRSAPADVTKPVREGGGITEWIYKGDAQSAVAKVEVTVEHPEGVMPLRYGLNFAQSGQRFELVDEYVENEKPQPGQEDVYFFYRYQNGHPVLNTRIRLEEPSGTQSGRSRRELRPEQLTPNVSVLKQKIDSDHYPELTYLGTRFAGIKLFREWNFGRSTPPRMPQKADLPEDFLLENAANVGLVINDLLHQKSVGDQIRENLKQIYEGIEDISTKIHGGTVQIYLHEQGLHTPVPATRLSDGTLRFLCLLCILCHPSPPPLVCIEEPELGVHPDVLPTIADLLVEASQRTQLIVTTHSDILVSALTETPESILVCERTEKGSEMRRLDGGELTEWLEKYRLGELWLMGEIGGTRW